MRAAEAVREPPAAIAKGASLEQASHRGHASHKGKDSNMTDVVIAGAVRTPVGAFSGGLSSVPASYLGTVHETLSRTFARLIREKIIAVDGPRVTVLDKAKLKRMV